MVSWQFWALLSAVCAALTAIFAKIGIEAVNSDFATLIRTVVIVGVLGSILLATGQWQPLGSISRKTYLFLVLSGLATAARGSATSGLSSSAMQPASRPWTS